MMLFHISSSFSVPLIAATRRTKPNEKMGALRFTDAFDAFVSPEGIASANMNTIETTGL
jgi:hypothetical protein